MLLRSFPALFDHYGYYNPTHSFRELDSAGGLQTSRPYMGWKKGARTRWESTHLLIKAGY